MESLLALKDSPAAEALFRYLGIATASYGVLHAANLLYSYLQPSAISRCLRDDKDTWAIVTGASDGIGVGFGHELAQRGFNVILHGRNKPKLEGIADKIKQESPNVKTRIFIADASAAGDEATFKPLLDMVKDLHVTVLINNVGGDNHRGRPYVYLQDFSSGDVDKIINLNATFATKITNVMLPILMENQPSMILNISSYSSIGIPMLSVYAGTKGYINSFSEALQADLIKAGKDVTVHSILVGGVATTNSRLPKGFFIPTPRAMAASTIWRAGKGTVTMAGAYRHAFQTFGIINCPQWLRQRMLIRSLTQLENDWDKAQ